MSKGLVFSVSVFRPRKRLLSIARLGVCVVVGVLLMASVLAVDSGSVAAQSFPQGASDLEPNLNRAITLSGGRYSVGDVWEVCPDVEETGLGEGAVKHASSCEGSAFSEGTSNVSFRETNPHSGDERYDVADEVVRVLIVEVTLNASGLTDDQALNFIHRWECRSFTVSRSGEQFEPSIKGLGFETDLILSGLSVTPSQVKLSWRKSLNRLSGFDELADSWVTLQEDNTQRDISLDAKSPFLDFNSCPFGSSTELSHFGERYSDEAFWFLCAGRYSRAWHDRQCVDPGFEPYDNSFVEAHYSGERLLVRMKYYYPDMTESIGRRFLEKFNCVAISDGRRTVEISNFDVRIDNDYALVEFEFETGFIPALDRIILRLVPDATAKTIESSISRSTFRQHTFCGSSTSILVFQQHPALTHRGDPYPADTSWAFCADLSGSASVYNDERCVKPEFEFSDVSQISAHYFHSSTRLLIRMRYYLAGMTEEIGRAFLNKFACSEIQIGATRAVISNFEIRSANHYTLLEFESETTDEPIEGEMAITLRSDMSDRSIQSQSPLSDIKSHNFCEARPSPETVVDTVPLRDPMITLTGEPYAVDTSWKLCFVRRRFSLFSAHRLFHTLQNPSRDDGCDGVVGTHLWSFPGGIQYFIDTTRGGYLGNSFQVQYRFEQTPMESQIRHFWSKFECKEFHISGLDRAFQPNMINYNSSTRTLIFIMSFKGNANISNRSSNVTLKENINPFNVTINKSASNLIDGFVSCENGRPYNSSSADESLISINSPISDDSSWPICQVSSIFYATEQCSDDSFSETDSDSSLFLIANETTQNGTTNQPAIWIGVSDENITAQSAQVFLNQFRSKAVSSTISDDFLFLPDLCHVSSGAVLVRFRDLLLSTSSLVGLLDDDEYQISIVDNPAPINFECTKESVVPGVHVNGPNISNTDDAYEVYTTWRTCQASSTSSEIIWRHNLCRDKAQAPNVSDIEVNYNTLFSKLNINVNFRQRTTLTDENTQDFFDRLQCRKFTIVADDNSIVIDDIIIDTVFITPTAASIRFSLTGISLPSAADLESIDILLSEDFQNRTVARLIQPSYTFGSSQGYGTCQPTAAATNPVVNNLGQGSYSLGTTWKLCRDSYNVETDSDPFEFRTSSSWRSVLTTTNCSSPITPITAETHPENGLYVSHRNIVASQINGIDNLTNQISISYFTSSRPTASEIRNFAGKFECTSLRIKGISRSFVFDRISVFRIETGYEVRLSSSNITLFWSEINNLDTMVIKLEDYGQLVDVISFSTDYIESFSSCSPQMSLVGLEVTQGTQDWRGSVQLVSNRKTAVRAFFTTTRKSGAIIEADLRVTRITTDEHSEPTEEILEIVNPLNTSENLSVISDEIDHTCSPDIHEGPSNCRADIDSSLNFILDSKSVKLSSNQILRLELVFQDKSQISC